MLHQYINNVSILLMYHNRLMTFMHRKLPCIVSASRDIIVLFHYRNVFIEQSDFLYFSDRPRLWILHEITSVRSNTAWFAASRHSQLGESRPINWAIDRANTRATSRKRETIAENNFCIITPCLYCSTINCRKKCRMS